MTWAISLKTYPCFSTPFQCKNHLSHKSDCRTSNTAREQLPPISRMCNRGLVLQYWTWNPTAMTVMKLASYNITWSSKFSVMLIFVKVSALGVFVVRIFPHSDWIRSDTEYLSVFGGNVGKYGPEKLRIRILFTQWKQNLEISERQK